MREAWGWVVCAVIPFLSLGVAQYVRGPQAATGFICYDLPYYVANGREIFERGNGFGYCNPYDPSADSPVIYYHLLSWILGVGVSVLGVDPAIWFLAIGAIASLAFALVTYRLVEAVLPSRQHLGVLYLLVMWGGGVLVVAAIAANMAIGRPPLFDVFRLDPHDGWWFLSWGRNTVFPTEATYHAIATCAWLGAVTNRPWRSVWAVGLLAATHPFSGIQQIAVLGIWMALSAITTHAYRAPLAVMVVIAVSFGAYYFAYLPSFESHRRIFSVWSLEWTLPAASLAAAYGPVAVVAGERCRRDWRAWRPEMTFCVVAACVSLLLAKHELFIPARQPLHFTRGYIWMPLCLLALPLIQRSIGAITRTWKSAPTWALGLTAGAVACFDNAAWLVSRWQSNPDELRTATAVLDIYGMLDRQGERGTAAIVSKERDNYLLATFTQLDPYLGHVFLCPDYGRRWAAFESWVRSGESNSYVAEIDVLILPRHRLDMLKPAEWSVVCENDLVVALRRR